MQNTASWQVRFGALAATALLGLGIVGTPLALADAAATSTDKAAAEQTETRTFVDSLGREVQVPATVTAYAPSGAIAQQVLMTIAPQKMVALASEMTDAQKKYFGEEYASLVVVGSVVGDNFNREAAAAAGAQVIIDVGQAKEGLGDDLDALQEQVGIPCIFIEANLDSYDKTYTMLGDLLGEADRAAELAEYCSTVYNETVDTMATIPEDERVTVAYLQGDEGLNAMPKGSYHGVIVDMCANNVVEAEGAKGGNGAEIDFEQIAIWDPELIIFGSKSIYDTVADDAAWATLQAIQNGDYYEIPSQPFDWMNRPPSVNQLLGIQWFPRLLYPAAFDDDIATVVADYYKMFYGYELTDDELADLLAKAMPADQADAAATDEKTAA